MQPETFYAAVSTRAGGEETNWPGFIYFISYVRIIDLLQCDERSLHRIW